MSLATGIWAIFAASVLVLLAYRFSVVAREDDSIHLEHQTTKTSDQAVLAKKMEAVDRWSKILITVTVLYGIALAAYWIYISALGNQLRGL